MSNYFLGYQHGYKEPGVETDLKFANPNLIYSNHIDNLIPKIFGSSFDYHKDISRSCSSPEEHYLLRLLILISYLQRIAGIPTFEIGKILEINSTSLSDELSAKIFIPYIDFAPLDLLKHIIISARNLTYLLLNNATQTEINLDQYWNSIETKIILPLKKHISSGGISTIPILNAASNEKIPYRHIGEGIFQVGIGKELRIISKSAVDSDSLIGAHLSSKKDLTARILRLSGIPTPKHISVMNLDEAQQAAQKIGFPVVIKPTDCERSEGVTTNISSPDKVAEAYELARKKSKNIIIEQQIPGRCFRLMVANKKFLYAVKRFPRLLTGNGKKTIQELFFDDQKSNLLVPPWQRKKHISLNNKLISLIAAQGYQLSSVLPDGKQVYLKEIESTEWGETTFDVTDEVCPENIQIAEQAASILNLDNAGVDIITTDISKSIQEVGGAITEINCRPHFGGTTAAKSRMSIYINDLINNHGTIQIEVYIGDDAALKYAKKRHDKFLKEGLQAYIVNHESIWSAVDKNDFPKQGVFRLTQRLLMNRSTEALIMVISTDELIRTGLPVNIIHKLKKINDNVGITSAKKVAINDQSAASTLESMFRHYLV